MAASPNIKCHDCDPALFRSLPERNAFKVKISAAPCLQKPLDKKKRSHVALLFLPDALFLILVGGRDADPRRRPS